MFENTDCAIDRLEKVELLQGKIDKKFRSAKEKPIAFNVKELISILQELPKDLPVESTFNSGVKVIVYNYGKSDCHVELGADDE